MNPHTPWGLVRGYFKDDVVEDGSTVKEHFRKSKRLYLGIASLLATSASLAALGYKIDLAGRHYEQQAIAAQRNAVVSITASSNNTPDLEKKVKETE